MGNQLGCPCSFPDLRFAASPQGGVPDVRPSSCPQSPPTSSSPPPPPHAPASPAHAPHKPAPSIPSRHTALSPSHHYRNKRTHPAPSSSSPDSPKLSSDP